MTPRSAHLDPAAAACQHIEPPLAWQVFGGDHALVTTLIVHLRVWRDGSVRWE